MKKFFLTAVFAFIGSVVFAQERIAVFPFEDLDNVLSINESIFFYRQFSNEFSNRSAGRFIVIPRSDVERLINTESAFQLSVFSAREKTAEMNRVLNGTQILSGIIGKVGSRITISISLYTYPELRQLPGGVDMRVANKDDLFDKIPELVLQMQNRISGGGISGDGRARINSAAAPANFVRVEGGTFTMGSPSNEDGRLAHESPQHQVTVNSFYMGIYEVTQKEYQEVMGVNNSPNSGDNLPAVCSWYDAIEYCNKLSLKEGLTPCYRGSGDNIICDWNANGYRLPTEAEWEYAAKGGNKDYLIYTYSGSNNPAAVAWYMGNSNKWEVNPVGTKQPNSLGIYDMSGNVSEWCWDLYGSYTSSAKTNPHGPATPSPYFDDGYPYRVTRGGGIGNSYRGIRSSRRGFDPPFFSWAIGFRVVRGINEK